MVKPRDVGHGGDALVDVVLLGVVDDVFCSLLLVAEDAALAVVDGQVHVHHLGVVPDTDLGAKWIRFKKCFYLFFFSFFLSVNPFLVVLW